jgi:hypothetical protein
MFSNSTVELDKTAVATERLWNNIRFWATIAKKQVPTATTEVLL